MAKFNSLIPEKEIPHAAEDFRAAVKVEQYRIGKEAVYIPSGLRWNYVPLFAVSAAEDSRRSVTAGHCVTVTEIKPAVELATEAGRFTLNLERPDSVGKILDAIGK
ncbi:MAG: hypothetical protein IJP64_01670 [Oscillospiraceae bacterium]|nr:hypothetical protein [Oscillospiraceae bacterium]